jgi:hypothetical protein
MLIKVDKQKTDTFIHISEAYIRLCFHGISTHACTCTCACMCPPQVNHISRVCECSMHVRVCVLLLCRSSIHCVCLSVCPCTSVCPDDCIYNAEVLSMCNKHVMLGQTAVIHTHTYTHPHTFSTFTQAQNSVKRHEEHAHSLKRCKSGKNAWWQGRQLVAGDVKTPVSKRSRELDHQL